MTVHNSERDSFKSAAEGINPTPKPSSWDRLENMLENDTLQQENKSYKVKLKWLSGSAACLLVVAAASFYIYFSPAETTTPQLAYNLEEVSLESSETNQIYDIDKLSILNDAELWVNVVEGSAKIKVSSPDNTSIQ